MTQKFSQIVSKYEVDVIFEFYDPENIYFDVSHDYVSEKLSLLSPAPVTSIPSTFNVDEIIF